MFWIILWVVLIVGAAVALALSLRMVFYKAMGAVDQAARSASVLGDLAARLDDMPPIGTSSPGPSVAADRDPLVARVDARRVRRDARRRVARRRHRQTHARWEHILGWTDGPVARGNPGDRS